MPERDPAEYTAEQLKAIDDYNHSGTRTIERKPFKPWLMMAGLMGVVIVLGGFAWLIGYLVEPYL
ncbi:DUF3094 family protein [Litorivicinus lipolyticus]|uniref:DUF3094 family protein n=1 Tax=Litorivicinus lipolyticus TaxID=418701 RepID=A0A5Q2QF75_9GAMM|nr:DUF3094 family protein [Litorivicinus lipolyticus]QGG79665.1 DUF3094 family protein [Litorivicinus lipolyticus]